jgi:putative (di)nucleoside polyphosphate hydrolase
MNSPVILPQGTPLPYRVGVGIVLINRDGLIWQGCRVTNLEKDESRIANSKREENWQMPQGGVNDDEEPSVAALRELEEETGTSKVEIVTQTQDWLFYDLPPEILGIALKGRYRGQKQRWFAMRFLGVDDDFNIHSPLDGCKPEFDAWRWAQADDVLDHIIDFKRSLYAAVLNEFRKYLR